MQRVRIGLTGLAFVFLAVLLAAIFTNQSRNELPITPNLIEQQRTGTPPGLPPGSAETEPDEPLAELGVAPGSSDSNAAEAPPPGPPATVREPGQ
jgi:hypothetical protein